MYTHRWCTGTYVHCTCTHQATTYSFNITRLAWWLPWWCMHTVINSMLCALIHLKHLFTIVNAIHLQEFVEWPFMWKICFAVLAYLLPTQRKFEVCLLHTCSPIVMNSFFFDLVTNSLVSWWPYQTAWYWEPHSSRVRGQWHWVLWWLSVSDLFIYLLRCFLWKIIIPAWTFVMVIHVGFYWEGPWSEWRVVPTFWMFWKAEEGHKGSGWWALSSHWCFCLGSKHLLAYMYM